MMHVYKKTLGSIAEHLCSRVIGGGADCRESFVYRIEYDSRKAGSGDIFVCLTGHKADGHRYAPMAYRAGCRAFLCEYAPDLPSDAAVILVQNTRAALAELSAFFYDYPADKLRIIGVTGTKGKTTTALMIASILNSSGKNCAYIGSNGVIINGKHTETVNTTPESRDLHHYFALMLNGGVNYAAIEVSSQALANHRVDGIPFAVKAFLNLSPDHIGDGEHRDFDEYKAAKASFFQGYGGDIVYNLNDPESASVVGSHDDGASLISFGMDKNADFRGIGGDLYRDASALGIDFACRHANLSVPVRLRSPGAFSIYNALAAIACTERLGVPVEISANALKEVSVKGRFEIVPGLPGRTFLIDYAHNGESLRRALSVLREYHPSRLIVVFGSVGGRTFVRRSELAYAASALADLSIITSDNPDSENPMSVINDIAMHMDQNHPYIKIADREEAIRYAVRISEEGDIVLFAGKGHETYQLIMGKKVPFNEAEIIKDESLVISSRQLSDPT